MLTARDIDRYISKRLMKHGTGQSTIALCEAVSIFGHYDRGNPLQDLFSSRIAIYVHR